jgi:histidine ammonia-lyase
LRAQVPAVAQDRYLAPDIEAAAALVADRGLTKGLDLPELCP